MSTDETRRAPRWRIDTGHPAAFSTRESVDTDSAVVVTLDERVVVDMWAHAQVRHQEMTDKRLKYKRRSTPTGQVRGLLGEAATIAWLDSVLRPGAPGGYALAGPEPGGADAYAGIAADGQGWTTIDAKTSDENFWRQNGRLVNADQLPGLFFDILMWCVTPEDVRGVVILVGWSPVAEVKATATPEVIHGIDSMRVHARLRPPDLLGQWLLSGRREPLPS